MTKTLSITKARDEFPSLVDKASRLLEQFVITVNGEPKAVVMSYEELESMKETMDILSDPELMKAIRQGEKEIKQGKAIPWEKAKKQLGWDV